MARLGHRAAAPKPVQPQRDDQPAGGMAVNEDRCACRFPCNECRRLLQFGVVAGQVGGEVRGLPLAPGPPAFAQVERVERESASGEGVGKFGVEEVVGVAVHREDGATGGRTRCRLRHLCGSAWRRSRPRHRDRGPAGVCTASTHRGRRAPTFCVLFARAAHRRCRHRDHLSQGQSPSARHLAGGVRACRDNLRSGTAAIAALSRRKRRRKRKGRPNWCQTQRQSTRPTSCWWAPGS